MEPAREALRPDHRWGRRLPGGLSDRPISAGAALGPLALVEGCHQRGGVLRHLPGSLAQILDVDGIGIIEIAICLGETGAAQQIGC